MSIIFCYVCCLPAVRLRFPSAWVPFHWRSLIQFWPNGMSNCFSKKMILFSKKLVRENKCKQKHCITCFFTLMQIEKRRFSRLRLYCTPAGTHLLRQQTFAAYYQNILLKVRDWVLSLIRAIYWDTNKDVWHCKNLGFCFAQCKMMEF